MKITKLNIFLIVLAIVQIIAIRCLEVRNHNIDYEKYCPNGTYMDPSISTKGE